MSAVNRMAPSNILAIVTALSVCHERRAPNEGLNDAAERNVLEKSVTEATFHSLTKVRVRVRVEVGRGWSESGRTLTAALIVTFAPAHGYLVALPFSAPSPSELKECALRKVDSSVVADPNCQELKSPLKLFAPRKVPLKSTTSPVFLPG